MATLKCKNCGRLCPGRGADMYVCPHDNSGHCDFSQLVPDIDISSETGMRGIDTIKAYTDITTKAKAEQQARYDYYYNKEIERLKNG